MQLQRHRADLLNQFAETSPTMHMLRTAISTFGHVANASRHTKAMLVAAVQIMVINKFCALLQSNTVTSYTGIRRHGKAWLGLGYSLYTSLRRMHRLSQFGAAG